MLTCILAWPTPSVASGGDVLGLIWGQGALLLAVLVSLFRVRMPGLRKLAVFAAYMAASVLANFFVADWPYATHALLINALCILPPLLVWVAMLVVLYRTRPADRR